MKHKPYVLVVRQLGGIGDVLMLSCLFPALRKKYPKHTIKLVTSEIYLAGALMDIATHNPHIDEIHTIEPYDATPIRTRQVWNRHFGNSPAMENELLWQMADVALDMNTPCVEYEWEAMVADGIKKPRYQVWCDAADIPEADYTPIYKTTKQERAEAKTYADANWHGATVVGLGLAAADKRRAWGAKQLLGIAQGLQEQGIQVVTIDPTAQLSGIPSLVGKRIRELMPLMPHMSAVISVDSGLLHMAGTMDVPVIGIFGPTDPDMRMGNYRGSATKGSTFCDCAPCWYDYHCVSEKGNGHTSFECMEKIKPELIIEETLRWVNM